MHVKFLFPCIALLTPSCFWFFCVSGFCFISGFPQMLAVLIYLLIFENEAYKANSEFSVNG
jgi:hypothetical protein